MHSKSDSLPKGAIISLFLFVLVDVLGYSIVLPLLPFFAERFGATPSTVGIILASNSLSQLLCAPLLGHFSDRYGRRPIILLCITGTFLAFILLANAQSITMVIVSRIIDGVFGGNSALAQACLVDISTKKQRAKGMGILGAAYGLGFIIGPAAGAALSLLGYRVPCFVAALLTLANFLGVYHFLQETIQSRKKDNEFTKRSWNIFNMLRRALQSRTLRIFLFLRLVYGLVFTVFETCFSLYNKHVLDADASSSGMVLAFVGFCYALVQGAGIGRLTKRWEEKEMLVYSFAVCGLSIIAWTNFSSSIISSMKSLCPFAFSCGVLFTVLNSMISKAAELENVGETLGLAASMGSISRVIGPLTAGFAIERLGYSGVGLVMGLLAISMAPFSALQSFSSSTSSSTTPSSSSSSSATPSSPPLSS